MGGERRGRKEKGDGRKWKRRRREQEQGEEEGVTDQQDQQLEEEKRGEALQGMLEIGLGETDWVNRQGPA